MRAPQSPDLGSLGGAIRVRRKALGLTQQQFADRMGWSQERVSVLETGKYGLPSLPLLAQLADALELPLAALLDAVGFHPDEAAVPERHRKRDDSGEPMQAVRTQTLRQLLGIRALTLKDAMNEASDFMAEAMGADKVDVFLYEAETETLVALGTTNTPMGREQARVGLDRMPIARGGRQVEVFQTGRAYYTGHADQDPEIARGVVQRLGVRSLYAVPLRVDGAIRGILVAHSAHPDRFSREERDFFDGASDWVGMVAQRVQLHEEVIRGSTDEARRMVADEMLAMVAHDLGNQIAPIKGRIDLLLRRMRRERDERYVEEMAALSVSMGRLDRMVNDLLDTSRLEGGIFSLTRRSADLVDLVRGVVDAARHERPEIEARMPGELLLVDADPARVTQALQNLVGNAVRHTAAGVPVLVRVDRQRRDDGEWAVVDVRDEGPGIAEDLLPRLFARHATGGEMPGLGLGLYLARGIAVAHGGDLSVRSEPGKGTTFTLALPIGDTPRRD